MIFRKVYVIRESGRTLWRIIKMKSLIFVIMYMREHYKIHFNVVCGGLAVWLSILAAMSGSVSAQTAPMAQTVAVRDSVTRILEIVSEDDSLSLDYQIALIERGLAYSQAADLRYEHSVFAEKKLRYLFAVAAYDSLMDLSQGLLAEIEKQLRHQPEDSLWIQLHKEALHDVGMSYVFRGAYPEAVDYFQRIQRIYPDDTLALAKVYNGMGIIAASKKTPELAVDYFKKAERIYIAYGDEDGLFRIDANIGLALLEEKRYAEALSYLLKTHEIALRLGSRGEKRIYANYYVAMAYAAMEDYEAADRFFQDAIASAKEKHYKRQLCFIQYRYAVNVYDQQRYVDAEREMAKALRYFKENKFNVMEAEALNKMALIKKAMGEWEAAFDYERQYSEALQELLRQEQQVNMQKLENSLNDYKLRHRLKTLELSHAQAVNRNLWIILLALVSCILVVLVMVLYRKFFIFRKRNKDMAQHLEDDHRSYEIQVRKIKDDLTRQIEEKSKTVIDDTLLFLRFGHISAALAEKVGKLKSEKSESIRKLLLYEIDTLVGELAVLKDFGELEMYFKHINQDFLDKLSERYPNLSDYEKHLCVFYYLNLSNKEIARLMQKSAQSISMAKMRAKTKMEIQGDEEFLATLRAL